MASFPVYTTSANKLSKDECGMEVEGAGRLATKSNYSFQTRGEEDAIFIEPILHESGSKFRPGPALRSCQPRLGGSEL